MIALPTIVCRYSDDEDVSWKVRRSAAKVLSASVGTRPELLPLFYRTVSPLLVARFSEREDSVRAEIQAVYSVLLKQTRVYGKYQSEDDDKSSDSGVGEKRKREGDGDENMEIEET